MWGATASLHAFYDTVHMEVVLHEGSCLRHNSNSSNWNVSGSIRDQNFGLKVLRGEAWPKTTHLCKPMEVSVGPCAPITNLTDNLTTQIPATPLNPNPEPQTKP